MALYAGAASQEVREVEGMRVRRSDRLVEGGRPGPGDHIFIGARAGWHGDGLWLLVETVDDAMVTGQLLIGGQRLDTDGNPHDSLAIYVRQAGLLIRRAAR